jgi:iron complex transport system substrate-binding protein
MKQVIQTIIYICGLLPAVVMGESLSHPQRIVSLGPIITEMIYLLGADQQLIANTSYCIKPDDAANKEKIGSMIQMNVEKIISLKPDLVLASPLSKEKQLEMLKNLGMRVQRIDNPKTFSEMCRMTMTMGELLGKVENARMVVEHAQKEVDAVLSVTRTLPKKRVFMQIGVKPLHSATSDTFLNEYIEYAGGINITSREKTGVYSREKVLQENPDVILITTMGSSESAGEHEKEIWMRYPTLKAARDREVHILDSYLVCSPTAGTFARGLKEIAKILNPEIDLLQ